MNEKHRRTAIILAASVITVHYSTLVACWVS